MAGRICIDDAIAALLASLAATASATTGGAPTPTGAAPPPASPSGTPDPAPSAGTLSLVSAKTSPRKSFYYGVRTPRLRYEIASDQPSNDLRIDLVGPGGEVVKSYYRNDIAPNTPDSVSWDGTVDGDRPAPGRPLLVPDLPQAGDPAARRRSAAR